MWWDNQTFKGWAEICTAVKEVLPYCPICGKSFTETFPAEVHHIAPKKMGGSKLLDTPENACPLCTRCHRDVTDGRITLWREDQYVYYQKRGETQHIIWELSPPQVYPEVATLDAQRNIYDHLPSLPQVNDMLETMKPTGKSLADALKGVTMQGIPSPQSAGYQIHKITTEQHVSLTATWFQKELYLKQLGRQTCENLIRMGQILSEFHADTQSYTSLGYENFEDFIAQPDIALKKGKAYMLIAIWESWSQHADLQELAKVGDYTRLYQARTLLKEGMDPQEALAKARELSRSDLKAEIDEAQGKKPGRWCDKWDSCGMYGVPVDR